MNFLKPGSPAMEHLQRAYDYFVLGLLWLLASVPILTFGTATTAMLQTAELSIHREGGHVFTSFWGHFRKEFRQATLLWLLQIPLLALLVFNLLALRSGQLTPALRVPVGLVCLLEACWLHLWFAYQSKFTDRIKTVLLNTIRLTLGNLGTTFLMVVLTAAMLLCAFFLLIWMGPLLLILPGLYVALYSALLRRLLRKSFPQ